MKPFLALNAAALEFTAVEEAVEVDLGVAGGET